MRDMDQTDFLATHAHSHRPLKRKLAADDDDAPGPAPPHTHAHTQSVDHQHAHAHVHAHPGPSAECGGSSSSAGGSSGPGLGISISIAPAAPRQPWIADADDPTAAAARWASPSPSPAPSAAPSPTTTAAPQISSPLSVCRTAKRLRVDTQDAILRPHAAHGSGVISSGGMKHYPRRTTIRKTNTPLLPASPGVSPGIRQGSDLEDIGVVSHAAPGPASGSLLRAPRISSVASGSETASGVQEGLSVSTSPNAVRDPHKQPTLPPPPPPPLSLSRSPHIPPMTPLITRTTLRELELDVILRNPVIRHDLLFDPGLQFRPRRTRAACERYWDAVWREVRLGCTCVTLDLQGGVHPTRCICDNANRYLATPMSPTASTASSAPPTPTVSLPTTPSSPTTSTAPTTPTSTGPTTPYPHPQPLYTLRTPPRLPLLLAELRAVLLLVVQPLSTAGTAVYTNPAAVRAQAAEHARHADELREVLDEVLEASAGRGRRGLGEVDLGPVFTRIGATLKRHCAPMRDRRVDTMVATAGQGGARAFNAVRMCLELLELMKLDIANHQLAQLRPWLLRNTSTFEAKAFRIRFGAGPSALRHTRAWLAAADRALGGSGRKTTPTSSNTTVTSTTANAPTSSMPTPAPAPGPLAHMPYAHLTPNQRIYLCVLKGLVDLVFSAAPGEVPILTLAEPIKKEEEREEKKDAEKDSSGDMDGDVEMSEEAPTISQPQPSLAQDGTPSFLTPITPTSILPETLYLDKTRLIALAGEASDATALYMLALLFRQLVGTDASVETDNAGMLDKLKDELRVLAPAGLGLCFVAPESLGQDGKQEAKKDVDADVETGKVEVQHQGERLAKNEKDEEEQREQRRRVREDVALQVASRVEAVRQRQRHANTPTKIEDTPTPPPTQNTTPTSPSPALLALAQRWTSTHMQPSAALPRLLHTRMRDAVLDEVIALLYPSHTNNCSNTTGVDLASAGGVHVFAGRAGYSSPSPSGSKGSYVFAPRGERQQELVDAERKRTLGLEPLASEIRRLAGRVARLTEVHLGTHLPVYENEGLLEGVGEDSKET